ncbi:MAG: hypothetical protein IPK64_12135 [bacterium]|nr:hypothetical protein [bacterium]
MSLEPHLVEPATRVGVLTVGGVLNILYRRRAVVLGSFALGLCAGIAYGLVVKPLYRATAQVRPGIVAYNAEGNPIRETALEDIVGWFDKALYWRELQERPEFAYLKTAPVIVAEFVPSLNFVQGGDVITLTNLSHSGDRARDVLDRGIEAFNRQAQVDSLGSSLHLTQRNARLKMERLTQDMFRIGTEQERTRLRIEEQKRELEMVGMQRRSVELDLQRLAEENAWRARAVAEFRAEAQVARGRVGEAEKLLARTLQTEHDTGAGVAAGQAEGAVSEVLQQTASREQAGRAGDLLSTVNRIAHMAINTSVRADSLEAVIKANDLEMKRLRLVLEIELAKKQADVEQKIRDHGIVLEQDLPRERALLQADWQGERTRLELASPLQRVGSIAVSEKPVRPRKLRAAAILTILGLFGGTALALAWEYLENNRAVITAVRRPGA